MSETNKSWLIGVHNTDEEGICMYRFYGTENEAKELLANLAKYDKETNINAYDHGTEDIEDVESEGINYKHTQYSIKVISIIHIASIIRHSNCVMCVILVSMDRLPDRRKNMKVTFKETNYKEVEVPDGTSLEELVKMVENCDVIVGDTTEADYEVNVNGEWYSIL